MRVAGYEVRTKKNRASLTLDIRRPEEPHSYDMVIPDSLLGVVADIINAVNKEKEEANG